MWHSQILVYTHELARYYSVHWCTTYTIIYQLWRPCSLFIYSTVDVPLGYFEFGAIVKDAAVNTHVDLYPEAPTFVNGYLKWNCWKSSAILDNATVVSIVVIPFYICTSRENSCCSKSLPVFGIVKLLNFLPSW